MATTGKYLFRLLDDQIRESAIALNENLAVWDILVGTAVEDDQVSDPSALSDTDGKLWIVGGSPAGDWASASAGDFALGVAGGWKFITLQKAEVIHRLRPVVYQLAGSGGGYPKWRKFSGSSWTDATV